MSHDDDVQGEVTRLIEAVSSGEQGSERLFELLYGELRQMAQSQMRRERGDHTLQPTALVHEAYARLFRAHAASWQDRGHFFATAALAMRRILVEHARKRSSERRGGGAARVSLDMENVVQLANSENPASITALDEAIRRLGAQRARMAKVIDLRFFAGLTAQETADALGVSVRTVHSDWDRARAWLFRELSEGPDHHD